MNRTRVLLADDNEKIRNIVKDLLREEFEVVGAVSDGVSAQKAARVLEPDVLVLDISMPVQNGIETAKRIRACGLKPWIVFLTVHEDEEFVRTAMELGAVSYVFKSRLFSDISQAIRRSLSGRPFVSPCSQLPSAG